MEEGKDECMRDGGIDRDKWMGNDFGDKPL